MRLGLLNVWCFSEWVSSLFVLCRIDSFIGE